MSDFKIGEIVLVDVMGKKILGRIEKRDRNIYSVYCFNDNKCRVYAQPGIKKLNILFKKLKISSKEIFVLAFDSSKKFVGISYYGFSDVPEKEDNLYAFVFRKIKERNRRHENS